MLGSYLSFLNMIFSINIKKNSWHEWRPTPAYTPQGPSPSGASLEWCVRTLIRSDQPRFNASRLEPFNRRSWRNWETAKTSASQDLVFRSLLNWVLFELQMMFFDTNWFDNESRLFFNAFPPRSLPVWDSTCHYLNSRSVAGSIIC